MAEHEAGQSVADVCRKHGLHVNTPYKTSISGAQVTQCLDQAVIEYGKPRRVRCDNGPEFAGKALDQWCYLNGIELYFIKPGKPTENCFVESFNGPLGGLTPCEFTKKLTMEFTIQVG